jgi:hypothetical protein
MLKNAVSRPTSVVGPLGEPLTLETLPPPDLKRWVPRRKAEVVAAVTGGLISLAEACDRYSLTLEEFAGWQRAVERGGLAGLRATRAQANRDQWAQEQRREANVRERRNQPAWAERNAASTLQSPRRRFDAPAHLTMVRELSPV